MTGALVALVLSTTWTLSVDRDEKAPSCPDEARLRRAIAERLGKDPFLDAPPPLSPTPADDELANPYAPGASRRPAAPEHQQLVVRFVRDGAGHLAVVSLRSREGRDTGRRELTSSASDCAELAGAVVLAAAIVIDPLVLTRPAPAPVDAGVPDGWATMPPLSRPPDAQRPPPVRPGEVPVSPPTWEPPPPPTLPAPAAVSVDGLPPLAQPPPAQPTPPTVVRDVPPAPKQPPLNALFVGAGGGVSVLQVATVAGLGQVQASWMTRSTLVGLAVGLTSPGGVAAGMGAVRMMLFDVTLHGCLRWKVLGGCATAGVGSFQAWSEGLPNPRPLGATFASAGLGGLLDVRLTDSLRLRALASAMLQPQITVSVGGIGLYTTPNVGFTLSASLHFKAWGDVVP
ncbi:MAG: hypothetical protein MUC96_26105 [Myxococcaceae bacterium]|jgi:hypothetical protein|nr:hypothetical protein [Myxococcaceae bacterium]